MALVQKNEIVEMKITGMTAQGAGVGHYQGMAVFTPLTAPGDVARVRVVKAAKNYAYGRLEELVSPSADRMEPDCPCLRSAEDAATGTSLMRPNLGLRRPGFKMP